MTQRPDLVAETGLLRRTVNEPYDNCFEFFRMVYQEYEVELP